ncbi:MAG TPA: adenosylhomocysteinase [Desulfotomaculum sp.]|nr:adenosylhomocysteinase [Desulfotomaculum sp.]HBY04595.1 adenosylhomocysteinase [Desulfotomaculum sp.]
MMTKKELVQKGVSRINWARAKMPVVSAIAEKWKEEKPLNGIRIGACLHVTTETANLVIALKEGGASVSLCASNPLSTQDDVAAALNSAYGIPTYAKRGEDTNTYYQHILNVLDTAPQITMDDGADLVSTIHTQKKELLKEILAGTEETTTGVIRLRSMEKSGALAYPIVAVNDALTKHLFDNRYGTGQSSLDGILRATNYLIAGTNFVVVGYGWCGKGVASKARGMGANVSVVEVDPLRALEALMDGFQVKNMTDAAAAGDIFLTVTGNKSVIDRKHFEVMKDGAILANSGHFNVEINIEALAQVAVEQKTVKEDVVQYQMADGRKLFLLAEGRLINLAAAEGHPAQVMDMSFANQALVSAWLVKNQKKLKKKVYPVPKEIDSLVARLKLESLGVKIESLTPEQVEYLGSWQSGT